MALPLPKVISDVGPGGGAVTSMRGMNALSSDMLSNQINAVKAQYAPWTEYADAASKIAYSNMLPYQIQATIMGNPMLWMALKDNPAALNALTQNLTKSIPTPDQLNSNMPPLPKSRNGGLINAFKNLMGAGSSQPSSPAPFAPPSAAPNMGTNAPPNNNDLAAFVADHGNNVFQNKPNFQVPPGYANTHQIPPNWTSMPQPTNGTSPTNGNALLPGEQGGTAGIAAKMTAPYTQSPYAEGKLIPDPNHPGQFISVPTSTQTTQLQNQLAAAQRTIPQLKTLGELWKPFMTAKGKIFLQAARLGNLSGFGDSDLPSKFAEAKLAAFTTVESYLKSIGVPVTVDVQKELNQMLEPQVGENPKGYTDRIEKGTQRIINDFVKPSLQQLGSGYESNTFSGQNASPSTSSAPGAPSQEDIEYTAKLYNKTPEQVKKDLGIK